jgi:hypothetical protein
MTVFVEGATLAGVTGNGNQNQSAVAALTPDVVVVAWTDASGDSSGTAIRGRLFSTLDGQPIGSEFQVNVDFAGNQTSPSVAALSPTSFVVTWTDALGDS